MPEDSPLHWTSVLRTFGEQIAVKAPETLISFRVSEAAETRYEDLADKNTEGTLTAQERLELEEL